MNGYYGYNPADYKVDWSFIGDTINKFGQAAVSVADTMSERRFAQQVWSTAKDTAVQQLSEAGLDKEAAQQLYNSYYPPIDKKADPEQEIARMAKMEPKWNAKVSEIVELNRAKQGDMLSQDAINYGGQRAPAAPIGGMGPQPQPDLTVPGKAQTTNQAQRYMAENTPIGTDPRVVKYARENIDNSGLQTEMTLKEQATLGVQKEKEKRLSQSMRVATNSKAADQIFKQAMLDLKLQELNLKKDQQEFGQVAALEKKKAATEKSIYEMQSTLPILQAKASVAMDEAETDKWNKLAENVQSEITKKMSDMVKIEEELDFAQTKRDVGTGKAPTPAQMPDATPVDPAITHTPRPQAAAPIGAPAAQPPPAPRPAAQPLTPVKPAVQDSAITVNPARARAQQAITEWKKKQGVVAR